MHTKEISVTERTSKSLKNMAFGIGGQLLNIIMSFIARTVLIYTMGDVYAGLAGNFTNILMVFSLADLGIGTAIIFALYKPIALDDKEKIRALMGLYQKAYTIIGFVIIGLGLCLTPFIHLLVKTEEVIPHLEIIFMLYVLNTASSYFLSYKGTLITANQKNYIVTNVVYITSIISYGIQIAILYLTRNYILSLTVQIATNMLQNVITMIIANRMYPYIKGRCPDTLQKREKRKIFSNMRALVFYRAGQVVINGTDSIVISAMVGIVETGLYSNYMLLFTTIKNLLNQVFNAITASVGNLAAIESDEKKYEVFNMVYFGSFWMYAFCSVCFFVLVTPFITLWLTSKRELSSLVVMFLVLNFYLQGVRHVNNTFRDTMGVFRQGRFIPLLAAVVNIVVSVALAPSLGVLGVMIGTTVCLAGVLVWMEPIVLFKYGFKRSPGMYFLKYILYLIITAAACFITKFICDLLLGSDITVLTFIIRLVICIILPNAMFALMFFKTKEFKMLFGSIRNTLRRKLFKKRGKHA